jgi:hypothetical protein
MSPLLSYTLIKSESSKECFKLTYEGYEKKTVGGLPLKFDFTNLTKSADDLNTL